VTAANGQQQIALTSFAYIQDPGFERSGTGITKDGTEIALNCNEVSALRQKYPSAFRGGLQMRGL